MVLSEAEAEAQLAALRREREALDRAITDLTLYLELGRRLTGRPNGGGNGPASPGPSSASATLPDVARPPGAEGREGLDDRSPAERTRSGGAVGQGEPAPTPSGTPPRRAAEMPPTPSLPEAGTGSQDTAEGTLSEGVLARRYGRALIEAALAVLEEAGRPLHASEILAVLAGRGFTLPGHDPVAALNTRLWKRSGAGGPLKRLGEAVYALATEEG